MYKHVHSKATYPLRVHQVGKGGKTNEYSLNTKSDLEYTKACSLKCNLQSENAPVYVQYSKWVKEVKGTKFSFNTKSNLEYAQTCLFIGNLPAESEPVHSRVSG